MSSAPTYIIRWESSIGRTSLLEAPAHDLAKPWRTLSLHLSRGEAGPMSVFCTEGEEDDFGINFARLAWLRLVWISIAFGPTTFSHRYGTTALLALFSAISAVPRDQAILRHVTGERANVTEHLPKVHSVKSQTAHESLLCQVTRRCLL